jgi:hypothetical protein
MVEERRRLDAAANLYYFQLALVFKKMRRSEL